MAEWIKWVFDGIGTEILISIVSLFIGGVGGYAIGKRSVGKQAQKAGDSSEQKQAFSVDNGGANNSNRSRETSSIVQKQEAGNNSKQVQTGSVKHGR